MRITPKSRKLLRLQALVFTLLFAGIIGLLAWLSTQYVLQADWTYGSRNTVSTDTRKLLAGLDQAVDITAYAREDGLLRKQIASLVGSYQRFKADIHLEFVNPDTAPERVRAAGIATDGELVVSYQGRSENVQALGEQQLTNALLRISRRDERWIVFLSGHGERSPTGETNHDLGAFGREMERKGLSIRQVNLVEGALPENTHLLVIASPQVNLLPGEVETLRAYIEQGGNLLWLAEPHGLHGLEPLAEALGIEFLPGVIVDANTRLFGIQNPSFVVVAGYPNHDITRELNSVTVFPEAAAIDIQQGGDWQAAPLLTTLDRTWNELDELTGEIRFDAGTDERVGPLDLGVALTRTRDDTATEDEQAVLDAHAHARATTGGDPLIVTLAGVAPVVASCILFRRNRRGCQMPNVHCMRKCNNEHERCAAQYEASGGPEVPSPAPFFLEKGQGPF